MTFAVGDIYCCAKQCKHCKGKDHNAHIYRCSERIYEEYIDHSAEIYGIWYDDSVNNQKYRTSQQRHKAQPLECDVLVLAEVVDKYQRRDSQQVQDVNTDRQAHQVGD